MCSALTSVSTPSRSILPTSFPPNARKDDASPLRPLFSPGGLIEQSNASLQRTVKADVRRRIGPPHRQSGPDLSRAGHSRRHPLKLEADLPDAGGGGAGIGKGPLGLGCHRHVHGGPGERWAKPHRAERLLTGAWLVSRAGGTVEAGIPGYQRKASAHLVGAVRRARRAVRAEGD